MSLLPSFTTLNLMVLALGALLLPLVHSASSAAATASLLNVVPQNQIASKYRTRFPLDPASVILQKVSHECHFDISLEWTNDVGSGVYSTPLLADFLGTGRKQIIVASYHQHIEVLDAADGHPLPGWPYTFPKKQFVASPFLVDMDLDGRQELAVATKSGEIYFFGDNGLPLWGKTFKLDKFKVQKNWFEGQDSHDNVGSFAKNAEAASPHQGRHLNQYDDEVDRAAGFGNAETDDGFYDYGYIPADEYDFEDDEFLQDSTRLEVVDHVNYVYVDPHILATPVVEDLDGDGYQEIIVPVSYFFDREKYKSPAAKKHLGPDVDIRKYVACAIAVYDLKEHKLKRLIPLDLTTDRAEFRAYLVSSPTIFDIDGDKSMDIIVGNSVGFVYVLSSQGVVKKNFPLTMNEIHTQILVGDFRNNGKPIMVAADRKGNVVAFDKDGQEVWENRVLGYPPETMAVGDIDANGVLDIVFGTTAGYIWALSADTGAKLANFPVKTGEIRAPVLLVQLGEFHRELGNSLAIVVPSLDGFVNVVDSSSGCVEKLDIGEQSFAQVLVDDLNGNGNLDLLVATKEGNIHSLSTPSQYHPLKIVPSRMNHQGVYVTEATRTFSHVTGKSFNIQFEIIDRRRSVLPGAIKPHYTVKVFLGGSHLLHQEVFDYAGLFNMKVPCPNQRISGVVVVEVTNEVMEKFTDSYSISFNTYFYRIFKWLVALPFFAMGFFVLFVKSSDLPLPM